MKLNEALMKVKDRVYPSTIIPKPIEKFIYSLYQFDFEIINAEKELDNKVLDSNTAEEEHYDTEDGFEPHHQKPWE